MNLLHKIPVTPIGNLQEELKNAIPLSIAIGHDNDVFVLLTEEQPPLINDRFPATITEEPYNYHVIHLKDGQKTVIELPGETWNYHFVQPIDEDHILLVGARSYYHSAENIEENARVYDRNGRLVRSFCLGDGIMHVHVTKNQEIWTGYFDEGTCGNYAWDEPIGSSGLVGWDAEGNKLDSLEGDTTYYIFECLALNSNPDDDIYFFFSIEGMVGIRKDEASSYYELDDLDFTSFAVNRDKMVVHHRREGSILMELERRGNRYETVRKLELIKPDGTPVIPLEVSNRENQLLFLDGNELYLYKAGYAD